MNAPRKSLAAVAATAALAGMTGVAHGESITAIGVAQVRVVAPAPLTNAKIVKAVSAARRAAVPRALEAARNQATRIAIAAGLQPGAVVEVVESGPSPFGYFFDPGTFGRFGPGQYCGRVQTVKRAPRVDGRPGRVISRRFVSRCYKPASVGVSLAVTYDATPVPVTPPVA
jgi:hypothetical protein